MDTHEGTGILSVTQRLVLPVTLWACVEIDLVAE
jgi:hypothetical protein